MTSNDSDKSDLKKAPFNMSSLKDRPMAHADNDDDEERKKVQNEGVADTVDDDDDDDDDEEDDSLWNDLRSAWKQHLVAILVALAAATLGYLHLFTPVLVQELENLVVGHTHVHDYQRMANVSFCEATDLSLGMMQFSIPRNLLHILEHHYQADADQDDASNSLVQHDELDCARAQMSTYVKGFTTVYKTPTIQQMTRQPSSKAVSLSFTGFAAKFINLSDKPKLLFWAGQGGHKSAIRLIAELAPMESTGTATTPGQSFFVTPVYDSSHQLQRWTLTADDALVVYQEDPFKPESLSASLLNKYQMQQLNLAYAKDYLTATGRPWLSYFPRPPPLHTMWPTDFIGQVHGISSQARHYTTETTQASQELHLKLTVSSVAPRVLEIDNFLSDYECRHLIQMAKQKGLYPSTVMGSSSVDKKTRSSETTWLSRKSAKIVDTLYRRAADVLQMDESLLRHASPHHDKFATHHAISEDLQLVHYQKGQEYTPHHDFIYPSIANRHQPTRFATLLIYLQSPKEGGETVFPRSMQTAHHDGLQVVPKMGKAVLFYNMLPDGNVDDLSQHGSNAVMEGEKWIANLWVWDPIID